MLGHFTTIICTLSLFYIGVDGLAFDEPKRTMLEVKWVTYCMTILDLLASPSNKHLVVHVSLNG